MGEGSSFGGGHRQQGPTRGRIDGGNRLPYHCTRSFGRAASPQKIGVTIPRPIDVPPVAALHALLTRWLPDAAIALEPETSGASTPGWRVDAAWPDRQRETFYLRLGEHPGERRDGEVRVHQLLTMQGVPVPEVVAWQGLPPELDRAATLTRAIPGAPLSEGVRPLAPDAVAAIATAAGRDLARINALPVTGYGWIDLPDATTGTLRAESPTRGDWLAEYDRELSYVLTHGLVPDAAVSVLRTTFAVWRNRAPDASTSAFLAHGDFDASHIFCIPPDTEGIPGTPDAYTGIIDFGEARGADPFYDLGHALLHDGEGPMRPIFLYLLAGYRTIRPLPDDAENAILAQAVAIGVRQLAIAHRWGSPYAQTVATRISHLLTANPYDLGLVSPLP